MTSPGRSCPHWLRLQLQREPGWGEEELGMVWVRLQCTARALGGEVKGRW